MQLARWVWVAMVAACGDNGSTSIPVPDATVVDAWQAGVVCTTSLPNEGHRNSCPSTAPTSKPPECARPAGVNWATTNSTMTQWETLPLPAGFFSEGAYGCLYAIAYADRIEVGSFGCAFHTALGDAFVPDTCGLFHASTTTCTTAQIAIEGCFTDGRPLAASGGIAIEIDPVADTARINAGYDTGSSGPNTSCTAFCD